jgi:hypothetical protein
MQGFQFQAAMGLSKLFSRNFFVVTCALLVFAVIELSISKDAQAAKYDTKIDLLIVKNDSLNALRMADRDAYEKDIRVYIKDSQVRETKLALLEQELNNLKKMKNVK